MQRYAVVVVGAGAAGCLAGIFSARAGASTLVLETRRQPGAKIRASGGGRCNVMPSQASLADFETRGSTPFVRNVLGSWPIADMRSFFEDDLGLPLVTEPSGKVFPRSQSARDVVTVLLSALARSGAQLQTERRVVSLRRQADGWRIGLDDGGHVLADQVVMATGGLSMPKTGSDGSGWRLLRGVGHRIEAPVPALVPLHGPSFIPYGNAADLAGLSLPARLTATQNGRVLASASGDFLFTHRGYSGPVVLDISRHWTQGQTPEGAATTAAPAPEVKLTAAWGPPALTGDAAATWQRALGQDGKTTVGTVVRAQLPKRLADVLCESVCPGLSERRATELERPLRRQLIAALCEMPLQIDASEGYRTAEVTSGGVVLGEVNAKTLESRLAPALFLCGETLDVSGRIGGFNFLWAWASGRRAGLAAASRGERQRQVALSQAPLCEAAV